MLFTNVTRGPGATTVRVSFSQVTTRLLLAAPRSPVEEPGGLFPHRRASLPHVTSPDSLLRQCNGPEDLLPPSIHLGLFITVESVRRPLIRSILLPVGRGVGITDIFGDLFQLTPEGFQVAHTPLHQALLPVCIILRLCLIKVIPL